jgi:SNF2 family DNA or RNA helicase
MLPRGRELTIQFSPSRRRLLKREERPKVCVYCDSDPSREKDSDSDSDSESNSGSDSDSDSDSSGCVRTDIMDLNVDDLNDEDDLEVTKSSNEDKKKGPIIPLGSDICQVSDSDCRHFAHKRCLAIHYEEGGIACPRCNGLTNRIHDNLHGNEYCKEISTSLSHPKKGFTASAKIEEAIKWFNTTVPDDDKAIILSFFKGSLDLIEGVLVEDLGIGCARYDGDIDKDTRKADLKRFKTEDTCRVLLASVQSGGTGLNITEANHVLFLDRWFNPCVHDQAESRAHRIGQKKEVNIAYLDIDVTIDVVMKEINEIKGGNANILLADGSSLGVAATAVGYRDICKYSRS